MCFIFLRQRKLEEALLYCGQFKDALEALLDWLKKTEKELSEDGAVHGDLDTVTALIDQHKVSVIISNSDKAEVLWNIFVFKCS